MKHTSKFRSLAATLFTIGCLTGGADAVAILTSVSGDNDATVSSTRGFEFNTTTDFLVTHLSFYDEGGDGLADSHTVGLWDSSGTLISQATVPAGTVAPLSEGVWRLADVPDFILPAGSGYVTGATFQAGSLDAQFIVVTTTIADVQYVGGRFINNGSTSLTFPDSTLSVGLGGGSIEVSSLTPIPEPTSALLFGLAALGFSARRRR